MTLFTRPLQRLSKIFSRDQKRPGQRVIGLYRPKIGNLKKIFLSTDIITETIIPCIRWVPWGSLFSMQHFNNRETFISEVSPPNYLPFRMFGKWILIQSNCYYIFSRQILKQVIVLDLSDSVKCQIVTFL